MIILAKVLGWLRSHPLAVIATIAYSLTLASAGIFIGRYHLLPLYKITRFAKDIERKIAIARVGDDNFVSATLKKNYHVSASSEARVRSIDTSRLPLLLEEVPLGKTGVFAASEVLMGGALAKVEDSLLVMDRLGNIFVFDFANKSLHKMDYGTFPNGINEAILDSGDPPALFAVRAHYMAYDPVASTLYVSLLKFDTVSRHTRFNISAISIDKKTLEKNGDWRSIFETEDIPDGKNLSKASGGRLLTIGNILYFTIGNFYLDSEHEIDLGAQSLESSFGKIYEYDLNTHQVKLKTIGHRNLQGLVFTEDGRLLSTEQGPEGGDALNVIVDGRNYGWPYQTYGTDYGKFSWSVKSPRLTTGFFEEPLYAWVPSPAISPVIQLAAFDDAWNGDLLIGSLKAQSLFRLRLAQDRVLFSEPIWIGHRIRDIVEFDHQIILMTDDPALIILSVDEKRLRANVKRRTLVELDPALAKCISCHHFGETNPSNIAPTLENILNKPIASDNFQGYSEALKKEGGVWDEGSLREFITNPNEFVPGSAMSNLGLTETEVDKIISALKRIGGEASR
jgi:aldose sugar dehydrogenase